MGTNAVPVDLTQTWDTARSVDGADSSMVFTPPKPDGNGGYVDGDGNPVDVNGRPLGDQAPVSPDSMPEPDLSDWKVNTGSLHDAEKRILDLTKTGIDEFEKFRDSVMQRAGWIFYAESEQDTEVTKHMGDPIQGNNYAAWSIGPDQYYANVKDPHPEQTEQIQYNQYQLLQSVGSVLELVGEYVAKINNTAQIYAAADVHSAPPTD